MRERGRKRERGGKKEEKEKKRWAARIDVSFRFIFFWLYYLKPRNKRVPLKMWMSTVAHK